MGCEVRRKTLFVACFLLVSLCGGAGIIPGHIMAAPAKEHALVPEPPVDRAKGIGAGKLILHDDFDGYPEGSDGAPKWKSWDGKWSFSKGRYALENATSSWTGTLYMDKQFTNFVCIARVKLFGNGRVGLRFCHPSTPLIFYVSTGEAGLDKSGFGTIASRTVSLKENTWYWLKLVRYRGLIQGNVSRDGVNYTPCLTYDDFNWGGHIGFAASGAGTTAIDEMWVYEVSRPRRDDLDLVAAATRRRERPADFGMIRPGEKTTAILIAVEADKTVRIAALELQRYLKEMTGVVVPLHSDSGTDISACEQAFLVGPGKLTDELAVKGLLDGKSIPQGDGFCIKSARDDARRYLVLAGGNGRGSLYAVYHYLDEICGAGFFPDGERIPRREEIPFEKISVTEEPRFEERKIDFCPGFYPRGLGGSYWNEEEWRHGLDWLLKSKFNIYYSVPVINLVNPNASPNFPPYRQEIVSHVMPYARERGIEFVYWEGLAGETGSVLGTDHRYVITATENPDISKGERVSMIYQDLLKRDPEAKKVYHDLWDFNHLHFQTEKGREYVNACPKDVILGDMYYTYRGQLYKTRFDYYYGRQWQFVIVDTMYYSEMLGGSLRDYIDVVRDLGSDPNASKCRGYQLAGECNTWYRTPLFGYVLTRLGWNPEEVDRTGVFEDFLERRYGPASVTNMRRSLNCLLDWLDDHLPYVALHRLGLWAFDNEPATPKIREIDLAPGRYEGLDLLRQSLEWGLKEKDRLKGDRLYESDMGDIARTYLTYLIAKHFTAAESAQVAREPARFRKEAENTKLLLAQMSALLSTLDKYWLSPTIVELRKNEDTYGIDMLIRGIFPETGGGIGLATYHRIEAFEFFHLVYRREVEAYLDELEARMARNDTEPVLSGFDPDFGKDPYSGRLKEIEQAFLEDPAAAERVYPGTTCEAIEDMLKVTQGM